MVIGGPVSHSAINVLEEIWEQMDVAVGLRNGVCLDQQCVKLASLVIPRQDLMLDVVAIPVAQIDRLLQHLIEDVTALLGQGVAGEDVRDRLQTVLHP